MKVQKINSRILAKLNYKGVCQFDKQLKTLNTFGIEGKAKVFLIINTIENLIDVMDYLKKLNQRIFVLGGGSNILVCDYFDGVVIKLGGDFNQIVQIDDNIEMGAGVSLTKAYNYCKTLSLGGFEESVGIPGTIGGAIVMNASCYNFEISKIVDYVIAYDCTIGKIAYFNQDECQFDYRKSVFENGNFVILRVGFKLNFKDKDDMERDRKLVLSKRLLSQPKGKSAGCVFKRQEGFVISKMLDDMGAKGMKVNDALVSNIHANFILNSGNATSDDVYKLISIIKNKFKSIYGIELQTEIKFLGE